MVIRGVDCLNERNSRLNYGEDRQGNDDAVALSGNRAKDCWISLLKPLLLLFAIFCRMLSGDSVGMNSRHLVINRQNFQKMPAGIAEINATPAIIVIDAHIFRFEGTTAIGNILRFQVLEYSIELFLGYFKRIVMRFIIRLIIKIQRKRIIYLHHNKMMKLTYVIETEYPRIEPGGLHLVV